MNSKKILISYRASVTYDEVKIKQQGISATWSETGNIIANIKPETEGFLEDLIRPRVIEKVTRENSWRIKLPEALEVGKISITSFDIESDL